MEIVFNKTKLYAHKKHNFKNKIMRNKKINYIRINIFPMVEYQGLEFLEKLNEYKKYNPKKITKENFSLFGDIISTRDAKPIDINAGYAKRFDDLANINTSKDNGKLLLVYFQQKKNFPMKIDMMEKHPLGSQLLYQ